MTCEGVVWDLGNVLIDWVPGAAIAAGVGADEARRFLAADDVDFGAVNHGPDGGQDWDEALAEVARTTPHWLAHVRAYREHFARSLVGEVPGSADLVRALDARGVPMWGLTNWSHELWPHAPARFAVLALLRDVVVSGTEGVAKPDPAIYAVLAARVDRPLERLLFVDDRPENVEAARDAGLDGVVFTDASALRAELVARRLLPA